MGGSAFAQHIPPILTPRMPRSIYGVVLSQTITLLSGYFKYTATPIEVPGKETFGDLDILVSQPLQPTLDETRTSRESVAERLKSILNAKGLVLNKGDSAMIFAVPWPKEDHVQEQNKEEEKFVQVDVETCLSHQQLFYSRFFKCHGDLWNILSSTIRPYGLRINNRGLYLCIPCIEAHDKKKSLIWLSSSPVEILTFLGLDPEKYWEGFESLDEIFKYAASCRMFILKKASGKVNDENILSSDIFDSPGVTKLTNKDKVRTYKRPMYAKWIQEFIPYCRSEGLYTAQGKNLTREQIRKEAFLRFGVRKQYYEREHDWRLSKHLEEVWSKAIKTIVPVDGVEPKLRASSMKTLKEIIIAGRPLLQTSDLNLLKRDNKGFYKIDKVIKWVENHWETAGQLGFTRQHSNILTKVCFNGPRIIRKH